MSPPPPSPSPMGVYERACVSADTEECARVGTDMLRRGGSAVDAAIATLLCVGVVNPHSMGLGGGFQMTVYQRSSGNAYVVDAREMAPALATRDMFKGNLNLTLRGGLPVAVPGELYGYWEAHRRFGRLPWAELFSPAVRICVEGHRVGFHLANALQQTRDVLLTEPSMREVFVDPTTGDVYRENDVVRRPVLANTLRTVADKGAAELYTGELGRLFAEDIRSLGGILTLEDLASYKPRVKAPVRCQLSDGLHMLSAPPPASGALLALILNMVDGFGVDERSLSSEDAATLTYHRFVEACKFAYARRTRLGDDRFVRVSRLLRDLTSSDYAARLRARIVDNTTFEPDYYGAALYRPPTDDGTAHVSVVAPNGDAVSVTSSINHYFGAKMRSASTGIVPNDVMGDFSAPDIVGVNGLPAVEANLIAPGKRPFSSMCPAIFVDRGGEATLVIGAAGGTRITTGTALVSLRYLRLKEDLRTAIDTRRLHHQLLPNELYYERGFDQSLLRSLERLGHRTTEYELGGPIVVAVARSAGGQLHGYSDARKGGGTHGF